MERPVSFRYYGDKSRAKMFKGVGLGVMRILESHMRFRKLKQGEFNRQINDWLHIKCTKTFSEKIVHITVDQEKAGEIKYKKLKCFCSEVFAMAYIKEVFEPDDDHDCYYYTVAVCHKGGEYKYAVFDTVKASDYAVYEVGQLVMVANLWVTDTEPCTPDSQPNDIKMCSFKSSDYTSDLVYPVIVPVVMAKNETYGMYREKLDAAASTP